MAGNDLETIVRARRGVRQESMYLVAAAAGATISRCGEWSRPAPERNDKPELAVLPSSVPQWNPAAIFSAGGFEDVLRTLKADYDVVILDTSPLAAVSDAAPLLSMVDGVLIVARVKKSPVPAVREMLSRVRASAAQQRDRRRGQRHPRSRDRVHVLPPVRREVLSRTLSQAVAGPARFEPPPRPRVRPSAANGG